MTRPAALAQVPDGLRAARGCLAGIGLGMLFWVPVLLGVWLIWGRR